LVTVMAGARGSKTGGWTGAARTFPSKILGA
jgi:hypothetical protein